MRAQKVQKLVKKWDFLSFSKNLIYLCTFFGEYKITKSACFEKNLFLVYGRKTFRPISMQDL